MKQAIQADDAPRPVGPYSQAVRAGNVVFLAGQTPFDPETGEQPDGFEEQARQTLRNLAAVARAAGGSLDDALRVGAYLRDMDDFPVFNRVYAEFFSEPFPARTTIQSNLPGFAIEIDAVLWIE
jgi:2-iminobutanoate/2-iminopropanoate deaminase